MQLDFNWYYSLYTISNPLSAHFFNRNSFYQYFTLLLILYSKKQFMTWVYTFFTIYKSVWSEWPQGFWSCRQHIKRNPRREWIGNCRIIFYNHLSSILLSLLSSPSMDTWHVLFILIAILEKLNIFWIYNYHFFVVFLHLREFQRQALL